MKHEYLTDRDADCLHCRILDKQLSEKTKNTTRDELIMNVHIVITTILEEQDKNKLLMKLMLFNFKIKDLIKK